MITSSGSHMWNKLSNPPSPRCGHALTLVNNERNRTERKLIVMGGCDGGCFFFHNTIIYHVNMNQWTEPVPSYDRPYSKPEDGRWSMVPRFAHAYAPIVAGNVPTGIPGKKCSKPSRITPNNDGMLHLGPNNDGMLILGGMNINSSLSDLILIGITDHT